MEYVPAKHLLHRSRSTEWFGTDHTMNIYRGCCHGCLYCDSRSDCYQVGEFDQVRAKADALRILRDDLARKVRPAFICTGAMSDPYNPFEEELQLTRHALELVDAYDCGVAIATKSDLIVRDMDILASIQSHSPVICKLTVTTADDDLAAKIEPHAPPPSRRLAALEKLSGAGLFAGVLLMPVLPFLEDSDQGVLAVVESAANAGAKFIYPALGVTMRPGQREYFLDSLERAFPGQGLKARYLRQYGDRYQCASPRARALWKVFTDACRQRGILYDMRSIIRAATLGYGDRQLTFFD
ncbi:MAG: radical SAM protein [Clostridiales bacterium]|nr:radical SAM protein [Clostridiales bacterium]